MIDFVQARADIEAMPGDLIAVPKAQLFEMMAKAEIGQRAERVLGSIVTVPGLGIRELKATA